MKILIVFVYFLLFPLSCCKGETINPIIKENTCDTIYAHSLGIEKESTFYLERVIDLKQNVCILPPGVTIKPKGGIIKNGIL